MIWFYNTMQQLGYKAMRLGCLENNEGGLKFWRKHGYIEIERKMSSDPHAMIVVMQKVLTFSI